MAAAAFYDLEGTLVSTNLVHTLGFYARNQQGLLRSLRKSASTLVSIPMFAAADSYSRMVFNDIFFRRYRGQSEDRLRFFAEDLFESVLKPGVFPGTIELIQKSRSLGLRQVSGEHQLGIGLSPLEGARQRYKAVRAENGEGPHEDVKRIEVPGEERESEGRAADKPRPRTPSQAR